MEGNKMKFFAEKGKGVIDFLNQQPDGIVTLKESQIARVQGDAMQTIQDAIDRQETDTDGKTAPTIESGSGARMMDDVARESEWYRTETTNERGYDDYKRRVQEIMDHGLSKNNTTLSVFNDIEQELEKVGTPKENMRKTQDVKLGVGPSAAQSQSNMINSGQGNFAYSAKKKGE